MHARAGRRPKKLIVAAAHLTGALADNRGIECPWCNGSGYTTEGVMIGRASCRRCVRGRFQVLADPRTGAPRDVDVETYEVARLALAARSREWSAIEWLSEPAIIAAALSFLSPHLAEFDARVEEMRKGPGDG